MGRSVTGTSELSKLVCDDPESDLDAEAGRGGDNGAGETLETGLGGENVEEAGACLEITGVGVGEAEAVSGLLTGCPNVVAGSTDVRAPRGSTGAEERGIEGVAVRAAARAACASAACNFLEKDEMTR